MPSQAQVAKIQQQRDAAQSSARTARHNEAKAKEETAAAKREKRAALMAQAKAYGIVFLILGAVVVGGNVVGGQLTRVTEKWGARVQWGALILGFVLLGFARRWWHYLIAIALISIGGVKISDMSRMRDLIPGDQTWENKLPDGKVKIVVVKDEEAANN